LRVRNVDRLEGWLHIEKSKNGEDCKVAPTRETSTLLAESIRSKESGAYILTWQDRQDGSRVAQPRKDWYSLGVRSGLGKKLVEMRPDGKTSVRCEGLQLHDLRRSAVRRMIRSGIIQTVAMRVSGHKTASVFRRYDIVDERNLEQAAKLLEPARHRFPRLKTDTASFAHS
jgi:hypothetical protein